MDTQRNNCGAFASFCLIISKTANTVGHSLVRKRVLYFIYKILFETYLPYYDYEERNSINESVVTYVNESRNRKIS